MRTGAPEKELKLARKRLKEKGSMCHPSQRFKNMLLRSVVNYR